MSSPTSRSGVGREKVGGDTLGVRDDDRGVEKVEEVRRKRGGPRKTTLLGKDVLSLTVQPGMDQAVAMAMLMISNSYR
ncbi:Os05g0154432 [Oryza sativa Japonica Group]|uniref:Os05g0154432 protein n=1 Tax=Oryza sativa subsp. japonica TaxID=39947 RepID=A0A0P0WI51_ORYSJ|nr:Os05g0154432 [Oryza sativa Japonica Group]